MTNSTKTEPRNDGSSNPSQSLPAPAASTAKGLASKDPSLKEVDQTNETIKTSSAAAISKSSPKPPMLLNLNDMDSKCLANNFSGQNANMIGANHVSKPTKPAATKLDEIARMDLAPYWEGENPNRKSLDVEAQAHPNLMPGISGIQAIPTGNARRTAPALPGAVACHGRYWRNDL